jgi:hypothetical protein
MSSTPPRTIESKLQSLSVQDTPHSRGPCSQFPSHDHHLRRQLAPYLEIDVRVYKVQVDADYFLQNVLHFTASVDISVIQTNQYEDQVKKYCQASPERARYHPFVLLVDLVLTHKGSKKSPINITFCRNDPAVIKGSAAKRSPDIIGAYKESIFISHRDSVDNLSKDGPKEAPFYWVEPVTYVEGKLEKLDLTDLLLPPGQTPTSQVETFTHSLRAKSARSPTPVFDTSTNSSGNSAKATSEPHNKLKKKRTPRIRGSDPSRVVPSRTCRDKDKTTPPLPPQSPPAAQIRSAASHSHSVASRYSIASFSSSVASGASHETKDVTVHYSDPMVQCSSYALELLSQGGLRSHVIGILVTDSQLQLLYHDRSIIIVSEPFNFVTDSERFVKVLNALSSLTASQWGLLSLNPSWNFPLPAINEQWVFLGKQLELKNGCVIELGEVISHQRGLIGRGTCVVRATCRKKGPGAGCVWDTKLVVKFSWPVESRTPEPEFLGRIYESANAQPEHHWVLQHLPKLLHSEDRPHTMLSDALITKLGDQYEQRVLRILVFEELQPITSLITSSDLAQSTIHIFRCKSHTHRCIACGILHCITGYQWVYEIPKIMHRDVSVNNMMYRAVDGKVFGVLNDFDLATYWGTTEATSKQRTGTKPFMAIDRLFKDPPRHMYRHDLESLLYSLAWVAVRYDNGKEIQNPPLQSWTSLNSEQLKDAKAVWLMTSDLQPTPNFVTLKVPLRLLRFLFSNCIAYRSNMYSPTDPGYFHETFDGRITFQTFGELLQKLMDPFPSDTI